MRLRRLAIITAVGVLGIAACGSDDSSSGGGAPSADDLDGRTFTSTEVTGYDLVADTTIEITFSDGSISARAGCNTLMTGYTLTDGALEVEMFATTMMACPDDLMMQDTWLAEFLSSGPLLELDDSTLTITGDDASITLVEVEDATLVGTTWAVTGTVANEGVSSVPAEPTASITIDEAGAVAVETGCNSGSGTVEIGDDTLTFGAIAVTERACVDDAINDLERSVLDVLQGEVRYEVDGNSLSLRRDGPDGEIGLELTAQT